VESIYIPLQAEIALNTSIYATAFMSSTLDPQALSFIPGHDQAANQTATPLSFGYSLTWEPNYVFPENPESLQTMYSHPTFTSHIQYEQTYEGEGPQQPIYAEHDPTSYPEPSTYLPPFQQLAQKQPPPPPQPYYAPYHAPSHTYCQQLNTSMQQSYLRHIAEITSLESALQKLDSAYTQVLEHLSNHERMEVLGKEIDDALQEYADDMLAQSTLSGMMREDSERRVEHMFSLQRVKSVLGERREADGRALEGLERLREDVRGLLGEGGLEG